ncbi:MULTISPECIES: AraC family transcriptional regulator [Salinicola]|uniref:AraC family transcriptional regulator n=1 Tax=Salinicola TaxID=404432 RepID=UPI0018E50B68|nr:MULTISPECIES: AraC family transcriptional regulator [Salinicola]
MLDELATLVAEIAQNDGDCSTPIPALKLSRCSTTTDPVPCIYDMGLGLIVQGGKQVSLGDEIHDYGAGHSLITTLDLPVVSYITHASHEVPYLGVWLALDAHDIAQLAVEPAPAALPPTAALRAMSVETLDEGTILALTRLLRLSFEPQLMPQLAPLIHKEIVIRLLNGDHGPYLRRLVATGSPNQHIAKVVAWLKRHYAQDLSMSELAAKAHMSPSTFRRHFRTVAGMSPLQYVKNLRLQDARQLMLHDDLDAGSAALRVGYESASQFSREYSRLFGVPPSRDRREMRQSIQGGKGHRY